MTAQLTETLKENVLNICTVLRVLAKSPPFAFMVHGHVDTLTKKLT